MITLNDYENQNFTKEQEQAINYLHEALNKHFVAMGSDLDAEDVWDYIDQLITEQILNNHSEVIA